jgi:hypothetical protein
MGKNNYNGTYNVFSFIDPLNQQIMLLHPVVRLLLLNFGQNSIWLRSFHIDLQ